MLCLFMSTGSNLGVVCGVDILYIQIGAVPEQHRLCSAVVSWTGCREQYAVLTIADERTLAKWESSDRRECCRLRMRGPAIFSHCLGNNLQMDKPHSQSIIGNEISYIAPHGNVDVLVRSSKMRATSTPSRIALPPGASLCPTEAHGRWLLI